MGQKLKRDTRDYNFYRDHDRELDSTCHSGHGKEWRQISWSISKQRDALEHDGTDGAGGKKFMKV